MSPIKVSVIIPFCNVEKYISQCIASVLSQTLNEIEIICVDDYSQDKSGVIVEQFAKKDDRIRLIRHEENKGPGSGRNTGLDYSCGRYIFFLDSDDFLYSDTVLESAFKCAEKHSISFVITPYKVLDKNNRIISWSKKNLKSGFYSVDPSVMNKFYIAAWGKLYKRTLFEKNKIRFIDHIYFEDVPVHYTLLPKVSKIYFLDSPGVVYRQRTSSITQRNFSQRECKDYLSGIEYICRFYKDHDLMSAYQSCLWDFIMEAHQILIHHKLILGQEFINGIAPLCREGLLPRRINFRLRIQDLRWRFKFIRRDIIRIRWTRDEIIFRLFGKDLINTKR